MTLRVIGNVTVRKSKAGKKQLKVGKTLMFYPNSSPRICFLASPFEVYKKEKRTVKHHITWIGYHIRSLNGL
jgi:hypothetical protein